MFFEVAFQKKNVKDVIEKFQVSECIYNKRRAVSANPRSRVNLYTHCLGTIDIPGQVVYLSRRLAVSRVEYCHSCNMTRIDFPNVEFSLN